MILKTIAKATASQYPSSQLVDNGKVCCVSTDLVIQELQRVTYPIAAAAWLTTDHFRWHTVAGYEAVPEDLIYGLIQQYFDPIVEATRYFLAPTGEQCRWLNPADWLDARTFAFNVIQKHYLPNISELELMWYLTSDS
ncbi:hypothetical protein VZG28_06360 [Synechococcus elongatus IITB4]|uniref:hypothetical protein n=1 Tax=Synechococcus elongatus TaxID=32046 RepID=UPI0030CF5823